MQFSERWLRTLVDPPLSSEALAELLTMSGLEVEERRPVAPAFSGVVVGKVLAVEPHPNADKLKLCQVDVGRGVALSIVCGAPNVAVGMIAPTALVGAKLPGGLEIKAAKVRGVESQGMLCSARELGLSEDHSGLLALAADAPIGGDFREYDDAEDHVFTIKLTPNLGHCLSVLGIAREVAALTGAKLTPPDVSAVPAASDAVHPFGIADASGCGRFTGRRIRNVNAAALTPAWMKRRLERAGQRSISALVDVTNYVMLELGRPLHVYDTGKLQGAIDVRFGRRGEKLLLLNGQTVEMDDSLLAITDDRGPIGLAGIMGGDSTKAETTTRDLFLESAFFFPEVVAGRARKLNFASDASHRFERGVDFDNNVAGIERATQLILEICGGEPGPTIDLVAKLPERKPVAMRVDRARKVLGVPVSDDEMMRILGRLELAPRMEAGAIVAVPPSYRFDIALEEDLVEEVARVYGFDRIPAVPPHAPAAMAAVREERRSIHVLRERLVAAEYAEVINFSFVDPRGEAELVGSVDPIKLLNPIASQLAVMRTSLLGGLVANIQYNLNRGLDRVRVFEAGRAYMRDARIHDGPLEVAGLHQPMRIAGAAFGNALDDQWGEPARAVDFYDVKSDVEALAAPLTLSFIAAVHPAFHPGRSARIALSGAVIGWIGELHPKWVRAYELGRAPILFELDAAPLLDVPAIRYVEVSKFPAVVRDLAMDFPEAVHAGEVLGAIRGAGIELVKDASLFDLYRGKGVAEGRKSLAFRVVIQDTARTLTDPETAETMAEIRSILAARFGGKLRG